jgi:hypothetical protein
MDNPNTTMINIGENFVPATTVLATRTIGISKKRKARIGLGFVGAVLVVIALACSTSLEK